MEKTINMLTKNGLSTLIVQQTWMFISSFSRTRDMICNYNLLSLNHLGTRAFEEISGEVVQSVAYTLRKQRVNDYVSRFIKLDESNDKQNDYFNKKYHFNTSIDSFNKLPNKIFAYWLSESIKNSFSIFKNVGSYVKGKIGLQTGDNDLFLRLWQEIDYSLLSMDGINVLQYWVPYNKAGSYRRWYGNNDYVLNWKNDGFAVINCRDGKGRQKSRPQNREYYFRGGLTWSDVCTGLFSMRKMPNGFIFDSCAPSLFGQDENYVLGLYNTKVAQKYLDFLAPTIHYTCGSVLEMPFVKRDLSKEAVDECINISKNDWDSYENSWDFKRHSLVKGETMGRLISDKYKEWEKECEDRFNQLKANEEELNRIFIDIYGLQDELTPEVEDKDVTVRKAELQRDIKSLLSYAVGCMFGRYSLDVEGLAYAGGEWDASKYSTFIPDDDNIIPITDEEYFEDDIVGLLCGWLKKVYGEDTLEQNLDFIASALKNKGNTSRDIIRNYFVNDFFKDHCKTYSVTGSGKRPIYWLFESGKQNGFKALIYLHRYNADTIGNLRVDYLHRMQRVYESELGRMQDMIDHSTNSREVGAATKRKEKLQKQLKECRDYDEKIGHLALTRTELDLDDGVKYNYRKVQLGSDGKFYEVLADSKAIMMPEKKFVDFKK